MTESDAESVIKIRLLLNRWKLWIQISHILSNFPNYLWKFVSRENIVPTLIMIFKIASEILHAVSSVTTLYIAWWEYTVFPSLYNKINVRLIMIGRSCNPPRLPVEVLRGYRCWIYRCYLSIILVSLIYRLYDPQIEVIFWRWRFKSVRSPTELDNTPSWIRSIRYSVKGLHLMFFMLKLKSKVFRVSLHKDHIMSLNKNQLGPAFRLKYYRLNNIAAYWDVLHWNISR